VDKWQSWELEMMQAEEEIHREERRTQVGWFVVGLCTVIASAFVLWVLSVVR
jgi:lysozyme family protein